MEIGVLKSPTIIIWGTMCGLGFTEVSLMNMGALAFRGIDVQYWEFFLVDFSFNEYEVSFLILLDNFYLKAYLIRY